MNKDEFEYDLFISYRRDPNLGLAREVERFVEAFHTTPVDVGQVGELRRLAVCVDGSDFLLPPPVSAEGGRSVDEVLRRYLARSRELLVLCSESANGASSVDDEVRWFLEHRGIEWIRLAYTEGENPSADISPYLPPSLQGRGLESVIAYDLRGYDERRARDWRKVSPFQEELLRLACDLLGKPAGLIAPSFIRAELERVRSSSAMLASNAQFESLLGDPARALLRAVHAHDLHPSERSEASLRDAYRAALLHHINRRASAMTTGSGPSYLAGRWKQGEVFVRTSPDGRWRVLVTERGRDGPNPRGEVYLISNESLRTRKLEGPGGRVEDVAFDNASRHILVTRYFRLFVYSLEGRLVAESTFQRWTKSPIPVVAGYALDRFVVGADSKGWLWLLDPGDYDTYHLLRSEWSKDPVVAVELSSDGAALAVVLESTAAEFYDLAAENPSKAILLRKTGVLCVRFTARDRLLVAGEKRVIQWYESIDGKWSWVRTSKSLPSAIDWVANSDDGSSLAAVGTDRRIFFRRQRHGGTSAHPGLCRRDRLALAQCHCLRAANRKPR